MQIIDDLILSKRMCVLATSDGIEPHACLMNYLVDHATMKFYFLSHSKSRKNKNIKKCPHVSLLIDRRDEGIALTIQGVYSPLQKKQTIKAILKHFLKKNPHMKEFSEKAGVELIRIQARKGQLLMGLEDEFVTDFKDS